MTEDYSGPWEPGPEDPLLHLPAPGVALHSTLIEKALRDWVSSLNGSDPLKRASQRDQAIRELKDHKVSSPAKLVDAALGTSEEKRDNEHYIVREDEPAEDPVDGRELLEEIRGLLRRYLVLPDHADVVVSLWVLHTFAFDAADTTPYIAFLSPTKRCGKSRALEIVRALASKAINADNMTAAAAYRTVEKYRPTLIADEVDTYFSRNDELRGMFNSGYRRGGQVLRCEGDNLDPKPFATFAPKALAMIGELDGRMAPTGDRSIYIRMRRKGRGETRERLRLRGLEDTLAPIRSRCARWAQDHLEELVPHPEGIPDALDDRAQEIWAPLVAIADEVGGSWPKLARTAATALSGGRDDDELGVVLLGDIRAAFARRGVEAMSTEDLIAELVSFDEHPWETFNRKGSRDEKHITARQLSRLLKPFGVTSKTIRQGFRTPKGYKLEDFADPFSRYLPAGTPTQSATSPDKAPKPQKEGGLRVADRSATDGPKPENPPHANGEYSTTSGKCGGVADENREKGGAEGIDPAACPVCGRDSCPGDCALDVEEF